MPMKLEIANQMLAQQALADLEDLARDSHPLYGATLDVTLEMSDPAHWPPWVWPPLLLSDNAAYWREVVVMYGGSL